MEKQNIIIIVIDALRPQNVGCYGSEEKTTPNIDELALDGLLFEKCFSQTNRTEPSLATIMSGKHPLNHGVTFHGTRHTEENIQKLKESGTIMLPQILSKENYTTLAVDWLGRWHERGYTSYGVKQSLLKKLRWKASNIVKKVSTPLWEFAAKTHRQTVGHIDHGPSCSKTTDSAIEKLENSEGEFFLFLHYWDTHAPYSPPEEYKKMFNEEEGPTLRELREIAEEKNLGLGPYSNSDVGDPDETLGDIRSAYKGCIRWVDDQIGRFVDYLKEENIWENTILIVTSDHGELLGEHGIYFKHAGLYDTSIHVPLLIRHSELPEKRVKKLIQHTDLLPTILNLTDIEEPPHLDGQPIQELNREEIFAEANKSKLRAIRTKSWKYITPVNIEALKEGGNWYGDEIKPELYNLEEDPDEESNLIDQETEKAEELAKELEKKSKEFKSKHEKGRIQKITRRIT